jgi:transcriptional regulator with XRE-family HTH domain
LLNTGYFHLMPGVPITQPEPEKIRALIWQQGHSQADFARMIGRPPRTVYGLLNNKPVQPVSVRLIRQVARGLRVSPSAISDWTGDDTENEPEPKALAS